MQEENCAHIASMLRAWMGEKDLAARAGLSKKLGG